MTLTTVARANLLGAFRVHKPQAGGAGVVAGTSRIFDRGGRWRHAGSEA